MADKKQLTVEVGKNISHFKTIFHDCADVIFRNLYIEDREAF